MSFLSIGVPSGSAELGKEAAEKASTLDSFLFSCSLLVTYPSAVGGAGGSLSKGLRTGGIFKTFTSPDIYVTAKKTPSRDNFTSNGNS